MFFLINLIIHTKLSVNWATTHKIDYKNVRFTPINQYFNGGCPDIHIVYQTHSPLIRFGFHIDQPANAQFLSLLMNLKFDKTDYTIVKILMNGIRVEKSIESFFLNVEQRMGRQTIAFTFLRVLNSRSWLFAFFYFTEKIFSSLQ